VANRLGAHRAGAQAVASAIVNAYPRNHCAWASYIVLYARRMPGTVAHRAALYSVSYARALFERFGRFRNDLRSGEDTEFHSRFTGIVPIEWMPSVRTAHRHPTNISRLLQDQYTRGRRTVRTRAEIDGGPGPVRVAWETLRGAPELLRSAWQWCDVSWRPHILRAYPLAVPATAAYALGALLSNCERPRLTRTSRVRTRRIRPERA
jgi:hypothetical protein